MKRIFLKSKNTVEQLLGIVKKRQLLSETIIEKSLQHLKLKYLDKIEIL